MDNIFRNWKIYSLVETFDNILEYKFMSKCNHKMIYVFLIEVARVN